MRDKETERYGGKRYRDKERGRKESNLRDRRLYHYFSGWQCNLLTSGILQTKVCNRYTSIPTQRSPLDHAGQQMSD